MQYLLRDIDENIWKQIKHIAIEKNTTIKQLIIDGLLLILKKENNKK